MGRLQDAANRRGAPFSARARIDTPAGRLNATVSYDQNGVRSVTAHRSDNDPQIFERAGTEANIRVSVPFRLSERAAFVSYLRAGYLAAFSLGGFCYALDGRLDIVRRQIASPDTEIIPNTALLIVPPEAVPLHAPFVGSTVGPILGTVVCLTMSPKPYRGAIMVMLPPLLGEYDFYDRLTSLYEPVGTDRRLALHTVAWGWPRVPEHRWDVPLSWPNPSTFAR